MKRPCPRESLILPDSHLALHAAGAEQHLEGRVLKVLYWEIYSWKTMDPVMFESWAAEPAPQLSDRAEHRERAAARALVAISAAKSFLVSLCSLLPPARPGLSHR